MSCRPVCPLCGENVKEGLGNWAGAEVLPVSAGTDWDPPPIPPGLKGAVRKVKPLPGILEAGRIKPAAGKKKKVNLQAWVVKKIFQREEGVALGEP